ncbi:hypothetical protein LNV09_20280 [Paucibacter sp. B2R-40]|uniref:hypothetical protein n=1 Tax=Paucibacter sp. B2R-40 TaxID=2893554 RepID=UPI0021E48AE2|nr:hypothetical protein [Paucibacter sp. B2R-40]MCV2356485.1 hypothetical protein [Paucibacter sp. B2R-40]
MNAIKLGALALILGGLLGLGYGGFTYTERSQAVKLGPIALTVDETHAVNVPVWAGLGAVLLGGFLLVFGGKR